MTIKEVLHKVRSKISILFQFRLRIDLLFVKSEIIGKHPDDLDVYFYCGGKIALKYTIYNIAYIIYF